MTTAKHGIELLWDPSLNKSTAFTEEEKQALGIVWFPTSQRQKTCN